MVRHLGMSIFNKQFNETDEPQINLAVALRSLVNACDMGYGMEVHPAARLQGVKS